MKDVWGSSVLTCYSRMCYSLCGIAVAFWKHVLKMMKLVPGCTMQFLQVSFRNYEELGKNCMAVQCF